ncbi:MAG: hypothetical protein JSW23_09930 [Planctomycetota bacterium]|nr:MAG: hypothetical protein JSW23_09930 [Planctomycetota bacterium]
MADEKKCHNESCGSDVHNEHLCFLMYDGFHLKEKEGYKQMVQDAQYRCENCGRTAKSDKNLCGPVAL